MPTPRTIWRDCTAATSDELRYSPYARGVTGSWTHRGVTTKAVVVIATALMIMVVGTSCGGGSPASSKRPTTPPTKRGVATTRVSTTPPRTTVPVPTVVTIVETTMVASVKARAPFTRFGEVQFVVTGSDGLAHEFCALLADTEALREQGLMGQRDLGGYDAMLFSWAGDTSSQFWMRTVPITLAIAWFDASGGHVGQTEMAPCGDSDSCPRYGASAPYRWGMETLAGGLEPLGVKPGVVLSVGGRCRAVPA